MVRIVHIETTGAITEINVIRRQRTEFSIKKANELTLLCQEITSRVMKPMLLHQVAKGSLIAGSSDQNLRML
jgi:hypothetical protein